MGRHRRSIVAHVYAPDANRRGRWGISRFRGNLRVDGYAGYKVLAERGEVQLAFYWSHPPIFYELAQGDMAPIAREALTRIAALYRTMDGSEDCLLTIRSWQVDAALGPSTSSLHRLRALAHEVRFGQREQPSILFSRKDVPPPSALG